MSDTSAGAAERHMPAPPLPQLFVYYRVPASALGPVVQAARAMQSRLSARWPGLQAQLLRRPELRDDQATLMECYAGLPAEMLIQALQAELAGSDLPQPRHAEWFEPLPD